MIAGSSSEATKRRSDGGAARRSWPILLGALLVAGAAWAQDPTPPRVVRASPDHGDSNVDPAVTEIRVEFDRDMRMGGYSWTGGGPTFPELAGRPRWESLRVCVLPVKLREDHLYILSLNSTQAGNFRSAEGVSLEPYPIWFRTGVADPAVRAGVVPPGVEQNRAAFEALRAAVNREYSYYGLRPIGWGEHFERYEADLLGADSAFQFAARTARFLAIAEDPHITVIHDGLRMPTFRRYVRPNIDPRVVSRLLQAERGHHEAVTSGRAADGVGYIRIDSLSRRWLGGPEPMLDALASCHDEPALIVDLRANGGGDEMLARAFAGCFVERPVVYAKHRFRDANAEGGLGPVRTRTLPPNGAMPRYEGRVLVLTGPTVMSSAEAFVLMMRAAGATLVGGTTYGSSGNPQRHDLPNGVQVVLPSWQAMRVDGTVFEGEGIRPDVEIKPAPGARRDAILEHAVGMLRGE